MKKILAFITILILTDSIFSIEEGFHVPEPNLEVYEKLNQKLLYGEPKDAAYAAEELMFFNSRRAVRSLVKALRGPDNFPDSPRNTALVKFYSARALGYLGSPYAAKPLIEEYTMQQEKITEFKHEPKKSMAQISTGESLSSPFFFDKDDYTIPLATGEMLRALGRLEYTPEAEAVLKDALKHKNSYIRASAADGLRLLEKVENLGPLKEVVGSETDDYAKASELGAICTLERGATPSFKELTNMLSSDDPGARMKASHYLGEIDLRLAEVPLTKALEIEDDPIVYSQMKQDLKRIMAFKRPAHVEE
ncbi:MAG: HEAT repeat domain-containing protein [Leptospiraceae bacterium]|nr:HEAT repeat domain-containing protein [Leptospiraceae bacterium]